MVEDERIVALDLERMLRKHGYQVVASCGSGEEAVATALRERPDLVLMDIRLKGGMDGIEAARRIGESAEMPVVYLTAHTDEATTSRALATKPFGYLRKPFDTNQLHATVEVAIQRHRAEQAQAATRAAEARAEGLAVEVERLRGETDQMASVLGHDLQEPLRMVNSFLGLLAKRYEGKLDAEADEFIHFARDGADRMQAMVQAVLAYSRITSRGQALVPVEADAALDEALAELETQVAATGARVTRDPLPRVSADAAQLRQTFVHLLSNALTHTGGAAPEVHVSCQPRPGQAGMVEFAVRDRGPGVPEGERERIFLLFAKGSGSGSGAGAGAGATPPTGSAREAQATTEAPRVGVGLALATRMVERHGGRIRVEPTEGGGATFRFTWPAAPDAPAGA